jgi:hypothetical protein
MLKYYIGVFLITSVMTNCRDTKKDEEVKMPVEADGGIGDGAPSLDSVLEHQKPAIFDSTSINKKNIDSLKSN